MKTFEGIPFPYDHKKRMVVPDALRCLHLRDHRKYTVLGELASEMGWKKRDVVSKLEDRRREKGLKYHALKTRKLEAKAKALNHKDLAGVKTELAKYGF